MQLTVLADNAGAERFHPSPVTAQFNQLDIDTLPRTLGEQVTRSQGLMVIILVNYQSWAYDAVKSAIPRLPPSLLTGAGDMNRAILPSFDDSDQECCYMIDHVDIYEGSEIGYSPGRIRLGQWAARRNSVVTWIRENGALVHAPERPVLTIFCDEASASKICLHYAANDHRWQRLEQCIYWTYLDCLYVMTSWHSTLEIARFNLETKEQALFNRKAAGSIIY
ncbi:hypothetical protein QBC47DRAFT_401419 [Echria macrotheca]|uniref:Uncharacterized protein n=1 Tax=Echria macrotheca TaxID=438768 RepID=A0AAJ0BGQ6_9PEZI|nr:hypothetical protein QBC47DRAFT_401419 [Echria macrotheca]